MPPTTLEGTMTIPRARFVYRGRVLTVDEFSRLRAAGRGSFLLLGDGALIVCDTAAEVADALTEHARTGTPSNAAHHKQERAPR